MNLKLSKDQIIFLIAGLLIGMAISIMFLYSAITEMAFQLKAYKIYEPYLKEILACGKQAPVILCRVST